MPAPPSKTPASRRRTRRRSQPETLQAAYKQIGDAGRQGCLGISDNIDGTFWGESNALRL